MQISDGEHALRRIVKLVKPGGWLLVEEPDMEGMTDGEKPLGPGMTTFIQTWLRLVRARGVNPALGRELERIITSTGVFSDVNVKKVVIPVSGKCDGESCLSVVLLMPLCC